MRNVTTAHLFKGTPHSKKGAEGNAAERYIGDNSMATLGVAVVIKEYAYESLTFRDAVAYELISKWISVMKEDMDTRSNYMGFTCESKVEIWVTKGLLDEAKEIILVMEIFRTQSGNTLRVSRFRFSNGMSVQIFLGGHSTLLLEGGLSGIHDEEKKTKVSSGYCYFCLDEGGPQSEVPTLVEAVVYRKRLTIITKDSKVMKELFEFKALESNVRRIQVKDIVKNVEDHLKTYSSAGMDTSWHLLLCQTYIVDL
ncbi:hypothetical protein Tco_1229832 [Tanacetum coccineum]